MEMQGRRREGITWLTTLAPNWEGSHNLQHHLWWHVALFTLEYGDHAAVLELYDTRFRNLAAPLTMASPDVYIDVQNAASILFRLQRLGVDVGNRWEELADKAEARIGDCQSAFTLPHWLMALTATGRTTVAERMIEAMRAYAKGSGTVAPMVRDYVLPIAEAQLAHAAGRHQEAVALMRPAIGGMYRLGGSHAQQDVLEQLSWTPPSRPAAPRISASSSSESPVAGRFRPSATSAGAKPPTGRRWGRYRRDGARSVSRWRHTLADHHHRDAANRLVPDYGRILGVDEISHWLVPPIGNERKRSHASFCLRPQRGLSRRRRVRPGAPHPHWERTSRRYKNPLQGKVTIRPPGLGAPHRRNPSTRLIIVGGIEVDDSAEAAE